MSDSGSAEVSEHPPKHLEEVETVVIRFAGDSGDGMQLTGERFTVASALAGNDLSTFPDFPAEIRAPAGTLAGVSGFQINFSSRDIHTPGDSVDVLVAMNPAALKANIKDLRPGGTIIANTASFDEKSLQRAGWKGNPLTDGSLSRFTVHALDLSAHTRMALEGLGLPVNTADRCKNFFALGLMCWLYTRPVERTLEWVQKRFGNRPEIAEANRRALLAGYHFGETAEIFSTHYVVREAVYPPGTYRNITGNQAMALGLIAGSRLLGLKLFYGSYPITPASDVLHELALHKNFEVYTFQAEDEIAACAAAIGASFAGCLGVTGTSGPGLALKSESINLAVMMEVPLIVCDIQRAGPSTGLPTKTEQGDLLLALFGRNSESPIPVVAASTPTDCFWCAIEAARITTKYMTPVILISDGSLANGAEPWLIPKVGDLPKLSAQFRTDPEGFAPYLRDEETLARPWVVPGTPGMAHRIGGLEKEHITGGVCYDPANHQLMTELRAEKVARIAWDIPPLQVMGPEEGELLVLGWGCSRGPIAAAVESLLEEGAPVAAAHLRHLNPFPSNLGEVLGRYNKVLIPEMNMGQLLKVVRAEFLVDAVGLHKVQGQPFKVSEVRAKVEELLSWAPKAAIEPTASGAD
ncbi:MAG: 2-oxoacid:acceptor oxidoreductase subunit alpha [Nitrospinota bacterium]